MLPFSIKMVCSNGLISEATLIATFACGESALQYAGVSKGMSLVYYNDELLFIYVDGSQLTP